jgi:RNA polymerase sigma-70 factor (ECF subfamily)
MHACIVAPPGEHRARELYERLRADDPTATSDLAVAYLDHLTTWLINHNPGADEHVCATAAEDALLALFKNPNSYKPAKQTLTVYLHMSASGDLKNLLRSERRHQWRLVPLEDAEATPHLGNPLWSANPADFGERRDNVAASGDLEPVPASVRDSLSNEEAAVLELLRVKERRTALYAQALGITQLPFKEQQRQVKRVKDRPIKRLERSGGKHV